MAQWLLDPVASRAAGVDIFKLPYPGGGWAAEMARNQELIELMHFVVRCVRQFSKSPKEWKKSEENELYVWMMKYSER